MLFGHVNNYPLIKPFQRLSFSYVLGFLESWTDLDTINTDHLFLKNSSMHFLSDELQVKNSFRKEGTQCFPNRPALPLKN